MLKASYRYDQFGQLIREDNAWADRTYLYHYDNGGNLTMVQECYYRTGTMHQTDLIQNISYTYGDATTDGTPAWKDLLTSYNGNTITYDAIGNPLNWGYGYHQYDLEQRPESDLLEKRRVRDTIWLR